MNFSTIALFLSFVALCSARDTGRTTMEPDVTPAAVAPTIMDVEDPDILEEVPTSEPSNETTNLDDVNLDDVTVEVTELDEEGKPINGSVRSKRHVAGAIVVKLLLKGKLIKHYVYKIVSGFKMGVLHGLIG